MPIVGLNSSEKEESFISSEDMEVDSSTQQQTNLSSINGYQIAESAKKGSKNHVSVASLSENFEPSALREAHVISILDIEERFFEAIKKGELFTVQSYLQNEHITPQTLLKASIFEGKSYTPLELAIQYEHLDILNLLLCSEKCTEEIVGCRVDKDKDVSILNYALNLKKAEACRLILKCPKFKPEHFYSNPSVIPMNLRSTRTILRLYIVKPMTYCKFYR